MVSEGDEGACGGECQKRARIGLEASAAALGVPPTNAPPRAALLRYYEADRAPNWYVPCAGAVKHTLSGFTDGSDGGAGDRMPATAEAFEAARRSYSSLRMPSEASPPRWCATLAAALAESKILGLSDPV